MTLIQLMQNNPALFAAAVALLSLAIGSFLNVVIHRMPKMIERQWRIEVAESGGQTAPSEPPYNLMVPRSQCPACAHAITAMENVPVVSYLLLRGKCAGCGTRISPRYPLVEVLTAVLSGFVGNTFWLRLEHRCRAALCMGDDRAGLHRP